jgi:GH15 family glucan-1,4-alpha-glucosidase
VVLLEEYGLIGDLEPAALVGRNGAIDWLCLPLFDSASCFSALLADEQHGRWLLAPAGEVTATARRYRPGTLVLETEFETAEGAVRRGGVLGQRPLCVRSVVVAAPNFVGACDA